MLLVIIIVGLVFGSFANAVIYRLHQQAENRSKNTTKIKHGRLSILKGRSMCPNCQHTLVWYDLIPLVSWISLGRKCRYCYKPISAQYPIVELATAGLFTVSYLTWSSLSGSIDWFELIIWLILLLGLVILLVYDLRWMLLPNKIVYLLIIVAIAQILISGIARHDIARIYNPLLGGLIISGIFYAIFAISKGMWIGGGDVKLGFLLGIIGGGSLQAIAIIFIASVLGSIITIPMVMNKKIKVQSKVPFGPFLIIAGIIIKLVGSSLIAWYKRKLLIS